MSPRSQLRRPWREALLCLIAGIVLGGMLLTGPVAGSTVPLFAEATARAAPLGQLDALRWRPVVLNETALARAIAGQAPLELNLFEDARLVAERDALVHNRSGSVSWVGRVRGEPAGRVVLVTKEGITVGSIRTASTLFMLLHAGEQPDGARLHLLYEVDESSPAFQEDEPTLVELPPAPAERTSAPQDDGSILDLMVVYTPAARDAMGGVTAIENLIDLGVTETNLSYQASGILPRIRLVHTALTDFDEMSGVGDPRDLLQGQGDGFMDEVHPLRDQFAADLVKLMLSTGGCGRAFIMGEVNPAFEAFAFCWTGIACVSPGYSFQHELGHVQGGRHQWGADDTNNAPFTFNHGYFDPVAGFRTIMAVNDPPNCASCPRRLAWANPDVLDPATGVPMGVPEGQPMAADNRKTLNATAFTIANFRVSSGPLFADGFETGDLTGWSMSVP